MEKTTTLSMVINYRYQVWYAIGDFFLRMIMFFVCIYLGVPTWIYLAFTAALFLFEVFYSLRIEEQYDAYNKTLISENYKNQFEKITSNFGIPDNGGYFYLIAGLLVGFFISRNLIHPDVWYEWIYTVILALVVFFLFMLGYFGMDLPKNKIPVSYTVIKTTKPASGLSNTEIVTKEFPNALVLQNEEDELILVDQYDDNDSKIARLESILKSMNSKVEAYMLESVLLGALAFSGFLTIVSSNILSKEADTYLNAYASIRQLFIDLFTHPGSVSNDISVFMDRNNLFLLIMFLSLICSVFFILVLILRLRYSDMSLKLDYLIRIMNIFNAKEEELINIRLESPEKVPLIEGRQTKISRKIDAAIFDAEKLSKRIKPVVSFMSIFRNVGLLFFFLILTVSGLFFSKNVSLAILVIAIMTIVIRKLQALVNLAKVKRILRRH